MCCAVVCTALVAATCLPTAAQDSPNIAAVRAQFATPPKEARPSTYWLWLNGYVNRDHLEKELKAYYDAGLRGVCVFDMGTRGPAGTTPPNGPAFMSDEWVDNFAFALGVAKKLGMDVQLSAASSWDMGGAWVEPADASMGLYFSERNIAGPLGIDQQPIFPDLPKVAASLTGGKPAFRKVVKVMAIPADNRNPGYDFIYRIDPTLNHSLSHAILQNIASEKPDEYGPLQLFAKEFTIAVSTTSTRPADFREIFKGSLPANTEATKFDLPNAEAAYVRLRIVNGHNDKFDRVELGEFRLFNTDGVNIVASHEADRSRDGADLLGYPPALGRDNVWAAANLNDGRAAGPADGWSSAGPPPAVIRDPATIVDLTDRVDAEGRLTWNAPAGKWTILCFVCANTGEALKVPSPVSNGLATDHFSRGATRRHLKYIVDRLERKLGSLKDTALKQLYLASYEVRGMIWTPDFIEQFKAYRGYDMTPFLAALAGCVVYDEPSTERFVYDYRKTLGDLLVDAYYGESVKVAHEAGLGIESEAGGPGPPIHQVPVDALKANGAIDEVRGEFWPNRPNANRMWVIKETAAAAHTYGKKRVHMEAFTSNEHWQEGPVDLKPGADRAMCEGTNHFVWHTASHLPPEAGQPGWVYHAGTHLNTNLTWWPMAGAFLDYLARASFALQQGNFVGDVCYYYGDQGFNFVPAKHIDPSLGFGFDYDVINRDVIVSRLGVKDGRLTLPEGTSYEVLALPERDDINLDVLRKVEELVRNGATIVGPKPTRATGLSNHIAADREVRELASKIWGDVVAATAIDRRYGQGHVVWGKPLRTVLRDKGVGPDVSTEQGAAERAIDFIHRRTNDADIYFVRNAQEKPVLTEIEFRVGDRIPELWDPATGRTTPVYGYRKTKAGVAVVESLPRGGSSLLVFRDKAAGDPVPVQLARAGSGFPEGSHIDRWDGTRASVAVTSPGEYKVTGANRSGSVKVDSIGEPIALAGPWEVRFVDGRGAPPKVAMDRLQSWTDHADDAIKHYSGIAEYQISFDVPADWKAADRQVLLDLGDLWTIADVSVNGQLLGVAWKPPYVLDITSAARAGSNTLTVRVANTWSNRLFGDGRNRGGEKHTRTNVPASGGRRGGDSPLFRSGLFGPVRLVPARTATVTLQ